MGLGKLSYSVFGQLPNFDRPALSRQPSSRSIMRKILLVSGVLLLTACGSYSPLNWLTPHTIDVQQGNYVTQDVVDKLQPGMTQAQVRFLLGTPLMADMFHANRWDYVYTLRNGATLTESRQLSVFFDADGKLSKVEGSAMPARRATLEAPSNTPAGKP